MSKKGMFALFAGLVAGTATGVLFSPTSGKKFRESLKKEVKAGGTGSKSVYKHFKALATNIKQTAEEEIKSSGLDKKAIEATEKLKKEVTKKTAPLVKKAKKTTRKATSKARKNVRSTARKVEKTASKTKKTAKKVKDSV